MDIGRLGERAGRGRGCDVTYILKNFEIVAGVRHLEIDIER